MQTEKVSLRHAGGLWGTGGLISGHTVTLTDTQWKIPFLTVGVAEVAAGRSWGRWAGKVKDLSLIIWGNSLILNTTDIRSLNSHNSI